MEEKKMEVLLYIMISLVIILILSIPIIIKIVDIQFKKQDEQANKKIKKAG